MFCKVVNVFAARYYCEGYAVCSLDDPFDSSNDDARWPHSAK